MGLYESWARQLLPTVAFPDFVQQLERMSGNQKVQLKQMQIEQQSEDWAMDTDVDAVGKGDAAQDDWGDGSAPAAAAAAGSGGAGPGDDPSDWELDLENEMAAAADAASAAAAAPKPASTLSADLQAKIAANRQKALEKRQAKAAAAAAAAAAERASEFPDEEDLGMPTPEEEAMMMGGGSSSTQPAAGSAASRSAGRSAEDAELDALMAEEDELGDLMFDGEEPQAAQQPPHQQQQQEEEVGGGGGGGTGLDHPAGEKRSAVSFDAAFK